MERVRGVRRVQLAVLVRPESKAWLAARAAERGVRTSDIVREALAAYVRLRV